MIASARSLMLSTIPTQQQGASTQTAMRQNLVPHTEQIVYPPHLNALLGDNLPADPKPEHSDL